MEKYKTVGVVGLGKKLDISILIDSPFYGTISIHKSQESVSLACFQLMNVEGHFPSNKSQYALCFGTFNMKQSSRFQILSIVLQYLNNKCHFGAVKCRVTGHCSASVQQTRQRKAHVNWSSPPH